MVPELIPVLGSQPAGDVSHIPGGRLPVLSARPTVTPATLKRAATNFAACSTEARWVWTVCLSLLPDSVATVIWTRAVSTRTIRLTSHYLTTAILICSAHSFPRATEFRAELWNLAFATWLFEHVYLYWLPLENFLKRHYKNTGLNYWFLPYSAMLVWYLPFSCVCPSFHLSVCLSVASQLCWNDWMNWAGIWHEGFLPPIPHCVVRKFGYVPKLVYFPLGLCPKLGIIRFFHGQSIVLSTKVVDGRACWRHCGGRCVVAVYYTLVNCNRLTPSLQFGMDLRYSSVAVDKISTDVARRAVRLRLQYFFFYWRRGLLLWR